MKLNPDCIRDILIKVEELPDVHHHWDFNDETIPLLFPNYTVEEVIYHLRQCDLNGFFIGASRTLYCHRYVVRDLSPSGHEFLANIRNTSIWKKVLSKGAEASLPIIVSLAKKFAEQYFLN